MNDADPDHPDIDVLFDNRQDMPVDEEDLTALALRCLEGEGVGTLVAVEAEIIEREIRDHLAASAEALIRSAVGVITSQDEVSTPGDRVRCSPCHHRFTVWLDDEDRLVSRIEDASSDSPACAKTRITAG